MKRIFRVLPALDAPELLVEDPLSSVLTGNSLIDLAPDRSFLGKISQVADWRQFYRVGANGFALSEEAWKHCMEMYYVITENDVELLSVVAGAKCFRIIHPREFLEPSSDRTLPCDLTYANALFRIRERAAQEVFCLEGLPVRQNEFKFTYDHFGFKGLVFDEIWCG